MFIPVSNELSELKLCMSEDFCHELGVHTVITR